MQTRKIIFLGIVFALIPYLLIIIGAQPSKAQPPFPKQSRVTLKVGEEGACGPSPMLTEEQAKTLEALQHTYMTEAMPLRRDLIALRLELRYLIRDPNVQPKILLDLQKKISELQAKLNNVSLSYQIRARSLFTKEQLKQLPPDFLMSIETGFGTDIGMGRGAQKGMH